MTMVSIPTSGDTPAGTTSPSPPPSTSSSSVQYQQQRRATPAPRLRTYRGGFHTSICDIFRDPTRRTDCCAVACCGVLSSDRSRFLLTGERPPPLWRRVLMYLIIPALLVAAMSYFAVEVPVSGDDGGKDSSSGTYGGNSYNDDVNNVPDENPTDNDSGGDHVVKMAPLPLTLTFIIYIVVLLVHGRVQKRKLREAILMKLYEERMQERGQEVDPLQMQQYLARHKWDTWSAHSSRCCYSEDLEFHEEGSLVSPLDSPDSEFQEREEDSCSRFWKCLSDTFWASCCKCWCQCCSICALAQEEREINRLTGNQQHTMDYITFQPFSEYFPSIQSLRENQVRSLWLHIKNISDLSVKLLKNVAAVLVVLILFALADIDSNFNFENMIVLLLTLGQAFFIEYLVHWRWNRFHLSFDSVVKYFACGFLLTTPMALVFEAIVSTVTTIAWVLIVSLVVSTDTDLADAFATDSKKAMKKLAVEHQGVFIFYLFLNSFVVAGLVEEMVKYFGYWMVIVPDLLPQDDVSTQSSENGDANIDSEEGESRQGESNAVTNNGGNRASAKSTGIGITVAMVSVALGFACCENLLYIFVYSPPSLGVEISTLLARSLFPVHPLCAAIQSIGVCKRDIEGDRKHGLGRILSPAILLHGSFDFVLMVAAYFQQVQNIEEGNDDDGAEASTATDEASESLESQLPALIAGIGFVAIGYIYYVCQSRAQTVRLQSMDSAATDQNSLLV